MGDQLTLDFSKALMTHEKLGQDDIPDYLSISFSGVDAVNHFFGPSSLENEDVVVQLDRILADLLAFVDETVGLKHTLIALAADHGMVQNVALARLVQTVHAIHDIPRAISGKLSRVY